MITPRVGSIELAGDLGVEAEPGEAALHVAALALVEADLILGGLVRFLREGRGIDAGGQVAGGIGCSGPVSSEAMRDKRQRAELTVGIVAQIGVEFFRLVGILDRAPELQFDVGAGAAPRPPALRARRRVPPGAGAPFR